jgi:arsenate reductase
MEKTKIFMKKKLLILCTGNSCRSQMAEAYMRVYHHKTYTIYSAGIEKHGLNPFAMGVLMEDGLDISNHTSNTVEELPVESFDVVITVCDHAYEVCPIFPGKHIKIHHNFTDPSKASGSASSLILAFRKTRDEIKEFCQNFQLLS